MALSSDEGDEVGKYRVITCPSRPTRNCADGAEREGQDVTRVRGTAHSVPEHA